MKNSFDPNEIATLTHVVDQACARLGGCDEITRETIAARVLARAAKGECDPDLLLFVAISSVRKEEADAAQAQAEPSQEQGGASMRAG
jgi:hypothetical protein